MRYANVEETRPVIEKKKAGGRLVSNERRGIFKVLTIGTYVGLGWLPLLIEHYTRVMLADMLTLIK